MYERLYYISFSIRSNILYIMTNTLSMFSFVLIFFILFFLLFFIGGMGGRFLVFFLSFSLSWYFLCLFFVGFCEKSEGMKVIV